MYMYPHLGKCKAHSSATHPKARCPRQTAVLCNCQHQHLSSHPRPPPPVCEPRYHAGDGAQPPICRTCRKRLWAGLESA
eukprot:1796041-Prymnesium_polylepis.1